MRKIFVLFVLATVGVFAIAGCGGPESGNGILTLQ